MICLLINNGTVLQALRAQFHGEFFAVLLHEGGQNSNSDSKPDRILFSSFFFSNPRPNINLTLTTKMLKNLEKKNKRLSSKR
jgi:hypothetical protein